MSGLGLDLDFEHAVVEYIRDTVAASAHKQPQQPPGHEFKSPAK